MRVVSELFAQSTGPLLRGEIQPYSAVALLSKTGLARCGVNVDTSTPAPDSQLLSSPWTGVEHIFRRVGEVWFVRFRGGEIYPINDHKGMVHIHTLLQRQGEYISTDALTAIAEGHDIAIDPLQISLGADQQAIDSIKDVLNRLREERDEAEEFSHHDEVVRIEAQMNQMATYLANETRRGGTISREPKSAKQSRDRVWKAIKRAIKNINRHSIPLAKHLDEELDRGRLARYRQTGIIWEL
jgi:hypothetical protein